MVKDTPDESMKVHVPLSRKVILLLPATEDDVGLNIFLSFRRLLLNLLQRDNSLYPWKSRDFPLL